MTRSSVLTDELVRQLVPVGQVDILVGLPTFNNAATVESVVTSIHAGLARHFPLERTVLINPDGGSDDGTPAIVRAAPLATEEMRGSRSLRTTHRVSAPFPGLPDRSAGVRAVFAAADLLQARVIVVLSPDLMNLSADWVADLTRPVWNDHLDLVLPIHPRHRFEGPLLHQLVRPLLRAAYGARLRAGLSGHFACSSRFASHMYAHSLWQRDAPRPALEASLVATALARDFALGQVHLGPCQWAARSGGPALPELFQDVVGAVFESLESSAPAWHTPAVGREAVVFGTPVCYEGPDPAIDLPAMSERFLAGARDLDPLLHQILSPETHARLRAVTHTGEGVRAFPDGLWAHIVYEFAAAHHRVVMNREHLSQALLPLYLGRTASFITDMAAADDAAIEGRIEALELEFEASRPHLVERWNSEGGTGR